MSDLAAPGPRKRHAPWFLLPALLAGCTGVADEPNAPGTGGPGGSAGGTGGGTGGNTPGGQQQPLCSGAADIAPSLLRRLSNVELQLTLQDLFQLPEPPSVDTVPADNDKEGFKTFSEVQAMSSQHVRAYLELSGKLADALLADAQRSTAVVGCKVDDATCLRTFVTRFGKQAYRRALSSAEIDSLVARAEQNALDAADKLRYAMQLLLSSAHFLYRVELGDQAEGLSTLQPVELASRLSFALWGRGPSLQLLSDAEAGALDSDAGLRKVAKAMLADSKAKHFYTRFFRQWLGYDQLRAPVVKPADWSDALMAQMQRETDDVLGKHAFGEGSVLASLTTNQTLLSPSLATFYGLPAPAADGALTIPASHARAHAGILGHASLLSLKSDGDRIALRGNWLRRTFYCASLHIPAEVANELGDLLVGLTRVEIVEKRNAEPACKGCHQIIDPIGVGLSNFDATGRLDLQEDITQYGIEPALPGATPDPFGSLAELAAKLQASTEVADCLSEKVFLYVHGRDPRAEDRCALNDVSQDFADQGHGFRALLSELVGSPTFRMRRAPSAVEE